MTLLFLTNSLNKHISSMLCYTLMRKFCTHRLKMANFNMLTMFFGKRNKLKVFILWRVRAELNFSFFSYDLVYTWNCVSAAVLVWWWQTVSGMTTIIGVHLLGIMNIHTKSHKDVGSSWWGILQLMNSKLIDQQRRPAGWARSQKRNVLPAGVGWGNKIKKCSTSGESDILTEL